MIYYFKFNPETKSICDVQEYGEQTPKPFPDIMVEKETITLNSKGYWCSWSNQNEQKIEQFWVDVDIYKKSSQYHIIYPSSIYGGYDPLIEFVDNILPKMQRKDKLKRILK